jgi:hypothetical protein
MNHEHEANYCRCDIADRVPADAAPDCEQRTRISRRAGENAFVNDMISLIIWLTVTLLERWLTTNYVSNCYRG